MIERDLLCPLFLRGDVLHSERGKFTVVGCTWLKHNLQMTTIWAQSTVYEENKEEIVNLLGAEIAVNILKFAGINYFLYI